jgi:hypothetical protein
MSGCASLAALAMALVRRTTSASLAALDCQRSSVSCSSLSATRAMSLLRCAGDIAWPA